MGRLSKKQVLRRIYSSAVEGMFRDAITTKACAAGSVV